MKTHVLRAIALLFCLFALAAVDTHAAASGEKYTFMLVHSANAGAWESTQR